MPAKEGNVYGLLLDCMHAVVHAAFLQGGCHECALSQDGCIIIQDTLHGLGWSITFT